MEIGKHIDMTFFEKENSSKRERSSHSNAGGSCQIFCQPGDYLQPDIYTTPPVRDHPQLQQLQRGLQRGWLLLEQTLLHQEPAGAQWIRDAAPLLLYPDARTQVELETKGHTKVRIRGEGPYWALSWLKAPSSAYTFKTLLRHILNWHWPHGK